MPNPFTSKFMSRLKQSRYLIGGFIALELLAIPAAAQMVHTVSFKIDPHVVAAEIPLGIAGRSDFLVSSNAPFSVTATGMVGEVDMALNLSGQMGELRYGKSAQAPGPVSGCAMMTSPTETQIYQATVRTAARRGTATEQAVILSFTYDPVATPEFQFVTQNSAPKSGACSAPGQS